MKKFLIALILTLIAVLFVVPVSAENHVHTWDLVDTKEEARVHITCTTCDQYVILPTDNLLCEHDFVFTEYDHWHGNMCRHCGYSVLEPHNLIEIGFVDGYHVFECDGCTLVSTHTTTDVIDEEGHHIICNVCGKTETYLPHTHENMWAYDLNDVFHYWECGECGYLECEKHDSDICTVCEHCSHPNLINSSTRDECNVECPDCGHSYCGNHNYDSYDEDTATCAECGREELTVVQYGLLLKTTEVEDECLVDILVDDTTYQYKCWNTSIEAGTFVRVKAAHDQIVVIGRRVEVEILTLDSMENLRDCLRAQVRNNYSDDVTLEEITVSSVTPDGNDLCVEFVAGEKVYFNSDVVVYDMTTTQMGTVEAGDVIVYFTPSEEGQKDTIIIIG